MQAFLRALQFIGACGRLLSCRSRTDSVKSVGGRRCSKLRIGFRSSVSGNMLSALPRADLTDQDLKEIGVSLGHRRQLLREITNLGKTAGAAASAPALPEQPIAAPTVTPPVEATGERRYLTVMFCDLVDSTGIAAKLDAEEWRDLVTGRPDGDVLRCTTKKLGGTERAANSRSCREDDSGGERA